MTASRRSHPTATPSCSPAWRHRRRPRDRRGSAATCGATPGRHRYARPTAAPAQKRTMSPIDIGAREPAVAGPPTAQRMTTSVGLRPTYDLAGGNSHAGLDRSGLLHRRRAVRRPLPGPVHRARRRHRLRPRRRSRDHRPRPPGHTRPPSLRAGGHRRRRALPRRVHLPRTRPRPARHRPTIPTSSTPRSSPPEGPRLERRFVPRRPHSRLGPSAEDHIPNDTPSNTPLVVVAVVFVSSTRR